jgi:SulP family sulfate permease
VAVGVGVFIANILTIDKLSKLHGEEVKTITDADDAIQLSAEEKALMDQTAGRVLLFYLSGPMIFGLAKAIAREHAAMREAEVLILDLTDVPHLGVTASLSLENVVKDALGNDRKVLIVGAQGQTRNRLEKLKVLNLIEPNHLCDSRVQAFELSLEMIRGADEPNLSLASEA